MIIPTERQGVELRILSPDDAENYFESVEASRQHLAQFSDETNVSCPDLASVQESIANPSNPDRERFGIWDESTFVGTINITPQAEGEAEVGYWLDARHTGNGYATIAASAIAKYGRAKEGIERVYAEVVEDNGASIRVLERAGFVQTSSLLGRKVFDFMQAEEALALGIHQVEVDYEARTRGEVLRAQFEQYRHFSLLDLQVGDVLSLEFRDLLNPDDTRRVTGVVSPRLFASEKEITAPEFSVGAMSHRCLIEISEDTGVDGYEAGTLVNFGTNASEVTVGEGSITLSQGGILRSFVTLGGAVVIDQGGMHFWNEGADNQYLPQEYSGIWVNGVEVARAD